MRSRSRRAQPSRLRPPNRRQQRNQQRPQPNQPLLRPNPPQRHRLHGRPPRPSGWRQPKWQNEPRKGREKCEEQRERPRERSAGPEERQPARWRDRVHAGRCARRLGRPPGQPAVVDVESHAAPESPDGGYAERYAAGAEGRPLPRARGCARGPIFIAARAAGRSCLPAWRAAGAREHWRARRPHDPWWRSARPRTTQWRRAGTHRAGARSS